MQIQGCKLSFQKLQITLAMLLWATLCITSVAEIIPVPVDRPAHEALVEKAMETNASGKTSQTADKIKPGALNSCLIELNKIAKAISVTPPPPKDAECIIDNPVSMISITTKSGSIALPDDMLNDCTFALEFARWVADVANPLAKQHLGSPITKVLAGNGFTCRRRNNLPTGKLSEHAFGNAIDLLGFSLADKSTFTVKASGLMNQPNIRFFAALRKTACGYFTTVLGPGANAAHATHLHLDLGIHGKTGNYRICE